jgi:hypothetical protein
MIQEEKIEYYANNIAKELCDIVHFSVENVSVLLKSRIRILMHDVLNDEISELEKKRLFMVDEYSSDKVPSWRKRELQSKISELNVELKKARKNSDTIRISREYELLKRECNKNLPKEFMERYYELQKQLR